MSEHDADLIVKQVSNCRRLIFTPTVELKKVRSLFRMIPVENIFAKVRILDTHGDRVVALGVHVDDEDSKILGELIRKGGGKVVDGAGLPYPTLHVGYG
jgi:hypothetical protein